MFGSIGGLLGVNTLSNFSLCASCALSFPNTILCIWTKLYTSISVQKSLKGKRFTFQLVYVTNFNLILKKLVGLSEKHQSSVIMINVFIYFLL